VKLKTRIRILTIATATVLLMATAAHAQRIHRWVDASGQVHYSDRAPAGAKAVVIAEIPKSAPPPNAGGAAAAVGERPSQDARQPPDVSETSRQIRTWPLSDYQIERERRQERERQDMKKFSELMRRRKIKPGSSNDSLQSQCRRRRESYCGQGDAAIGRADNERAWKQYEQADRMHRDAARTGTPFNGSKPRRPNVPRP
jgi:hypothetical protein